MCNGWDTALPPVPLCYYPHVAALIQCDKVCGPEYSTDLFRFGGEYVCGEIPQEGMIKSDVLFALAPKMRLALATAPRSAMLRFAVNASLMKPLPTPVTP